MYMWDKKAKDFAKNPDGRPTAKTSHTLSPVPLYLYDPTGKLTLEGSEDAGLTNLAATTLEALGFEPPADYRASLLRLA
jgi:2,3-bisphosphoglycerate-independent phosphoglycerate mutase